MTDERRDEIERLERRIAALEEIVRRLTDARIPEVARRPINRPVVVPRAPIATIEPASVEQSADLEQWFGQRGLLGVGVAALIIAAAFFLKYAFDHGWVPPVVRSLLAIVAGIGVAAWGHERIGKGMRRYGAAMIGAGGGLVYLGLWAAAGPYGLVERRVGILLLAATTIGVTVFALHHAVEGLALWALVGAYVAPMLLPPPVPNPNAFLGYLEVIGLGTGLLAYAMSWRLTFNVALFGYLLLATSGAFAAVRTPTGCWLLAAGALLTLHVTRRRPWPEARIGILALTWAVLAGSLLWLGNAGEANGGRWLALGAAAVVTGLLWWQHFERDATQPAERFLFVANPIAFLLLAAAPQIPVLAESPEIVPAVLGGVYATAGWVRRYASFMMMGFALVALAMALAWPATSVTIGWTLLAVAALAAEREGARPGGRNAAAGLAAAAGLCLFSAALSSRYPDAPVFADAWALALYVYIAGTAIAARWWGNVNTTPGAELLWLLCAGAVFAGGSVQFAQYFGRFTALAGDLALSVWWLLYAGAAVWLGFRLNTKVIRSAGLGVAAGAGLKIVLYDLSRLEALYRVASFFALAMIALAVAYAYNRRARVSAA